LLLHEVQLRAKRGVNDGAAMLMKEAKVCDSLTSTLLLPARQEIPRFARNEVEKEDNHVAA